MNLDEADYILSLDTWVMSKKNSLPPQASWDYFQPCEGHEDHQVWQLFSEELSPPWRCFGFRSQTHAGVQWHLLALIHNAPGPPWATTGHRGSFLVMVWVWDATGMQWLSTGVA